MSKQNESQSSKRPLDAWVDCELKGPTCLGYGWNRTICDGCDPSPVVQQRVQRSGEVSRLTPQAKRRKAGVSQVPEGRLDNIADVAAQRAGGVFIPRELIEQHPGVVATLQGCQRGPIQLVSQWALRTRTFKQQFPKVVAALQGCQLGPSASWGPSASHGATAECLRSAVRGPTDPEL